MATGRSVSDILAPKQILKVVSRVKPALTTLSSLFGFNIGGSNRVQFGGRHFFYDVFNRSRAVAGGRAPGQASDLITPQKVGEVIGVFPRAAETMALTYEDIHNRRRIGGPVNELDSAGERYITRQEMYLGERFANLIEFQTAAMLRGSYVFVQNGDRLHHDFTGSGTTINFRIPSGNLDQLNMLGGGNLIAASWATASTDIPAHLFNINSAMIQLTGYALKHCFCKSDVWQYVLNNTKVAAQGGTSNVVFERIAQDADGNFTAVLRSIPWLQWHIIEHGLEVGTSGTYTDLIEDDHIAFAPDPSPEWCEYLEGSEIVVEGPGVGAAKGEQFGFYPYAYPMHDPAGWNLAAVHNGMPALYVPAAIAYADVTP